MFDICSSYYSFKSDIALHVTMSLVCCQSQSINNVFMVCIVNYLPINNVFMVCNVSYVIFKRCSLLKQFL